MLDKLSRKAGKLSIGGNVLSEVYLAWNTAITEAIYNTSAKGVPVYLDLDDDKFAEVAAHPSLKKFDSSKAGLAFAVENVIDWTAPKSTMLWPIVGESRVWMRKFLRHENPKGSPPMVAFLAVVVLAAEAMGNGDANANAYYAQLFKILNVEGESDKKKLEGAYKDSVLLLWGYLKKWLTELEWTQGIPTAEALSFPYVSVAMSQALVREGDRRKLSRMFDLMNFTPGEYVSPTEMTDYFNIWIQREDSHVSNSLKALWSKNSARERISEVLSKELEVWDGHVWGGQAGEGPTGRGARQHGKLKLSLKKNSYMGVVRLVHGLVFNTPTQFPGSETTFYATSSPDIPLIFSKASKTQVALQNTAAIPLDTLLIGDLQIQGENLPSPVRRIPKDVVVLAFDEELQAFLEVEKAALGQALLVFIRDQAPLIASLQRILTANAAPGFKVLSKNTIGLPTGWLAITDVQLISAQTSSFELRQFDALTPLASSQLILSGGLKIPGPITKKYLSGKAPILTAVSQNSNLVAVELYQSVWADDTFEDRKIQTWESMNGTVYVELSKYIDEDGDYRAVFLEAGTPTMQRDLYLRSGMQPDALAAKNMPHLGHSIESFGARALFEAHEITSDTPLYITGASANFEYSYHEEEKAGEFAGALSEWLPENSASIEPNQSTRVVIPQVESDSCIYTGKHKRNLPMCTNGAKYVLGVCENCGEQKPEYCNAYLVTKKKTYEKIIAARVAQNVEPIYLEKPVEVDFDYVLSLFSHVITGTASSMINALEALATDDISSLQIFELMEQLGHIEVTRSLSGKPEIWSLVKGQVNFRPKAAKSALLGLWRERDLESLSDTIQNIEVADGPRLGLEFETPEDYSSASEKIAELGFDYGSPNEVVNALRPLSWVRENLPRLPLPASDSVDVFDAASGKWIESEYLTPGAIRFRGQYGVRYYYIDQDGVKEGVGVSSSASIVKYLAANESSRALIKYSKKLESIFVPLGAKIPGLYGRSVLLASGVPPVDVVIKQGDSQVKVTQYKNVPFGIAKLVSRLLTE